MLKAIYHLDYNDIPSYILNDPQEIVASEEANNYSSINLHLERNVDEISDYDLQHGGIAFLKGEELKTFWVKFVKWLTEQGLPKDVNEISLDIFW